MLSFGGCFERQSSFEENLCVFCYLKSLSSFKIFFPYIFLIFLGNLFSSELSACSFFKINEQNY